VAEKVVLREEIIQKLGKDGLNDKDANEYMIKIVTSLVFNSTTVAQAKELAATKMVTKEAKDTGKLKKLYEAGVPVPGAEIKKSLRISLIDHD